MGNWGFVGSGQGDVSRRRGYICDIMGVGRVSDRQIILLIQELKLTGNDSLPNPDDHICYPADIPAPHNRHRRIHLAPRFPTPLH
jgi:hypothetical protein